MPVRRPCHRAVLLLARCCVMPDPAPHGQWFQHCHISVLCNRTPLLLLLLLSVAALVFS